MFRQRRDDLRSTSVYRLLTLSKRMSQCVLSFSGYIGIWRVSMRQRMSTRFLMTGRSTQSSHGLTSSLSQTSSEVLRDSYLNSSTRTTFQTTSQNPEVKSEAL